MRSTPREPGAYLHGVVALLEEWEDGEIDRNEVEFFLGLGESDTELTWLKDTYNASTDKVEFLRVLKRILYLAEFGWIFTSKTKIMTRLNALP